MALAVGRWVKVPISRGVQELSQNCSCPIDYKIRSPGENECFGKWFLWHYTPKELKDALAFKMHSALVRMRIKKTEQQIFPNEFGNKAKLFNIPNHGEKSG